MKRIAVLGSTGSIGCSALAVVAEHADRLHVVALAAGRNTALLAEQMAEHRPLAVSVSTPEALEELRHAVGRSDGTAFHVGERGLSDLACRDDVDLVLCATSGTAALEAVLAAIACGKTIALANKEVLVMAGALVMEAARRHGVEILPVDSEHNAIHQCLHLRDPSEIRRLILTASGGPFRAVARDALPHVTREDALSHPTWRMGPKITVDSATLMNKGLEVIEARWLFEVSPARIQVLIHPQSVVHSMVELCDGSVIAQLGVTDMRLPIQYAFSYPERWGTTLPSLDLARYGRLDFAEPDEPRFPCLALAYRALDEGGASPTVLNAANETAVEAFLNGQLPFTAIASVIETVLDSHSETGGNAARDLADVKAVDAWARNRAHELVVKVESRSLGV